MYWGMGQAIEGGGVGHTPIRFGTYNIRNGRNSGLELALRGMGKSNVDVGVFQETKMRVGIYTRGSSGYKVVATLAPICHRGNVGLFYWESPTFTVRRYASSEKMSLRGSW